MKELLNILIMAIASFSAIAFVLYCIYLGVSR